MIYTDGTPTIVSQGVSAPINDPYYDSLSTDQKVTYLAAYFAAKRLLTEEDNEPREIGIRDSEA